MMVLLSNRFINNYLSSNTENPFNQLLQVFSLAISLAKYVRILFEFGFKVKKGYSVNQE